MDLEKEEEALDDLHKKWDSITRSLKTLCRNKGSKRSIHNVCDKAQAMTDSGKFAEISWADRRELILLLVKNRCYAGLDVFEPMSDLLLSIPQNDEEKRWLADGLRIFDDDLLFNAVAMPLYEELGVDPDDE